jgi:hypothetical protein
MRRLRSKLSYANVMATIAVFIALGGGAYAATQLKKNSVGTKQLKASSVTTAKIKANAVIGSKVQSATLGLVPSATHATSADSATKATEAGEAASVNGQKVQRISFVAPDNTPATTLFEALGLKVVASCSNTGALEMHAVPTTTDSEIQVFGDSNNTFFSFEDSSFGVSGPIELTHGVGKEGSAQLVYGTFAGHVATMNYSFDSGDTFSGHNKGCGVSGEMVFG